MASPTLAVLRGAEVVIVRAAMSAVTAALTRPAASVSPK
jgi:hypothetical protein